MRNDVCVIFKILYLALIQSLTLSSKQLFTVIPVGPILLSLPAVSFETFSTQLPDRLKTCTTCTASAYFCS